MCASPLQRGSTCPARHFLSRATEVSIVLLLSSILLLPSVFPQLSLKAKEVSSSDPANLRVYIVAFLSMLAPINSIMRGFSEQRQCLFEVQALAHTREESETSDIDEAEIGTVVTGWSAVFSKSRGTRLSPSQARRASVCSSSSAASARRRHGDASSDSNAHSHHSSSDYTHSDQSPKHLKIDVLASLEPTNVAVPTGRKSSAQPGECIDKSPTRNGDLTSTFSYREHLMALNHAVHFEGCHVEGRVRAQPRAADDPQSPRSITDDDDDVRERIERLKIANRRALILKQRARASTAQCTMPSVRPGPGTPTKLTTMHGNLRAKSAPAIPVAQFPRMSDTERVISEALDLMIKYNEHVRQAAEELVHLACEHDESHKGGFPNISPRLWSTSTRTLTCGERGKFSVQLLTHLIHETIHNRLCRPLCEQMSTQEAAAAETMSKAMRAHLPLQEAFLWECQLMQSMACVRQGADTVDNAVEGVESPPTDTLPFQIATEIDRCLQACGLRQEEALLESTRATIAAAIAMMRSIVQLCREGRALATVSDRMGMEVSFWPYQEGSSRRALLGTERGKTQALAANAGRDILTLVASLGLSCLDAEGRSCSLARSSISQYALEDLAE